MQIDSISFNSLTRKINPHLILFIGFIALLRLYTEGTALFEDIVFKIPEGGSNLLVFLLYLTLKGVYLVSQVNDLMSIENLMIIRKSKQSFHRKLLIRIFISSLLLSVILLVAAHVFGNLCDALREKSDLNFRRTGVAFFPGELSNDFGLNCFFHLFVIFPEN